MSTIIEQHFRDSWEAFSFIYPDQMHTLSVMADRITDAFRTGNKLLICGNGGSAADAQHIAAEFVVRYARERRALPALALTTDSSVLTAGSNDYGYASVFARQVEALGKPGDVIWTITTSGMSENVRNAVLEAKQREITVLGFTGRDGMRFTQMCDLSFAAGNTTAITQQLHMVAAHAICDQVEFHISREHR